MCASIHLVCLGEVNVRETHMQTICDFSVHLAAVCMLDPPPPPAALWSPLQQGGTAGNDSFTAAAVDQQNGSVVFAGQMSDLLTGTETTFGSFAVLRLDAGGTVLWEFQVK